MTLERVKLKDKKILNNLIQLYLHNLSQNFKIDFDSKKGLYIYEDISKYFINDNDIPLFIKDEDNILGFILLNLSEKENIVQELFILNNYKRLGYGKKAITEVFNTYKGNWCIKVVPCTPNSENFWINTVNEYTKGKYKLERTGKYNRAEIYFNN